MQTTRALFTQLRQRLEPVLSVALKLRLLPAPLEEGDYARAAAEMDRLLEREKRQPLPAGLSQAHLQACRLATCIFADELLLALPQSRWFAHSLQLAHFGRSDGGQYFYTVLADLLQEAGTYGQSQDQDAGPQESPLLLGKPQAARTEAYPFVNQSDRSFGQLSFTVGAQDPAALAGSRLANLASRGGLSPWRAQDGDGNAALAAAAFLLLCLVYGFRGALYAPDKQLLLEEMLKNAQVLLEQLQPAPSQQLGDGLLAASGQQGLEVSALGQARGRTGLGSVLHNFRPGPFVLILAPIVAAALWYLVCARLINSLQLPWGLV